MQLVIDANILIAAFLKSANTRKLLLDENIELFAPEYFSLEAAKTIKDNKSVRSRIGLSKEKIDELLTLLFAHITIIPREEYSQFMSKAGKEVPLDDAPYLALSLLLKIPIWSNDLAFKKQSLVKVFTTSELLKLFSPSE